uniref:Uncharacterized protein n=1 Tax=Megaselia scalaris TaxID=36166 RepID=T1GQU9_MEGSC
MIDLINEDYSDFICLSGNLSNLNEYLEGINVEFANMKTSNTTASILASCKKATSTLYLQILVVHLISEVRLGILISIVLNRNTPTGWLIILINNGREAYRINSAILATNGLIIWLLRCLVVVSGVFH